MATRMHKCHSPTAFTKPEQILTYRTGLTVIPIFLARESADLAQPSRSTFLLKTHKMLTTTP